jgi:hypothetical protein
VAQFAAAVPGVDLKAPNEVLSLIDAFIVRSDLSKAQTLFDENTPLSLASVRD